MSLLICVKSCRRDQVRGYHQAIRDTWGRGMTNIRFCVGDPHFLTPNQEDEIPLECADSYMDLPWKTQAILQYSLRWPDVTHTFLIDNDTFLKPELLKTLPYLEYDFSGYMNKLCPVGQTAGYKDHMGNYPQCHPWASGGVGYFVSRKAAEIVAATPPKVWAEDMYVGQVLGPHIQAKELTAAHLENFNEKVSWHFRRTRKYREYNPEMMYRSYHLGDPNKMYDEDNCKQDFRRHG